MDEKCDEGDIVRKSCGNSCGKENIVKMMKERMGCGFLFLLYVYTIFVLSHSLFLYPSTIGGTENTHTHTHTHTYTHTHTHIRTRTRTGKHTHTHKKKKKKKKKKEHAYKNFLQRPKDTFVMVIYHCTVSYRF